MTQGEQWEKHKANDGWFIFDSVRLVATVYREEDADAIIAAHNAQADVLTAIRSVADSFHIPGAYADPPRPVRELLVELGAKASEQADVLTALQDAADGLQTSADTLATMGNGEGLTVNDVIIYLTSESHRAIAALERAAGGQIGEKKGKDI